MYQKKLNSGNYGAALLLQINDILQEEKEALTVGEIYNKVKNSREPKRNTIKRIRTATEELIKAGKAELIVKESKFKTKLYFFKWKQQ